MSILGGRKEKSLLSNGYTVMPIDSAISTLRALYTDVGEGVKSPDDLLQAFGIQTYGRSLLEVLGGLLDTKYEDTDVQVVNGKLLWKHGEEKVRQTEGWEYFS